MEDDKLCVRTKELIKSFYQNKIKPWEFPEEVKNHLATCHKCSMSFNYSKPKRKRR